MYLNNNENIIEPLSKDDKKLIIELICNEQTHMIVKDHTKYESEKYKKLEQLKVKIKDIWGEIMAVLTFFVGLFIGAIGGIFGVALCTVGRDDRDN